MEASKPVQVQQSHGRAAGCLRCHSAGAATPWHGTLQGWPLAQDKAVPAGRDSCRVLPAPPAEWIALGLHAGIGQPWSPTCYTTPAVQHCCPGITKVPERCLSLWVLKEHWCPANCKDCEKLLEVFSEILHHILRTKKTGYQEEKGHAHSSICMVVDS